ncbi:hypothetical protein GGI07_002247 [Coemansia sp. Benny D115]|nr:hypothetical protein GGI07_002247 [Coemansia sp. Benny D115]
MNNPEFIAQLDAANNPEDAAELAKQLIAQIKAQKGSIPDNLAGPFSTYLEALEDSKVSTDMRSIMNELVSFVEGVKEISPEVFGLKPTKAAASTSTGPSPLPTSKATQDADDVDEQVSTSAAAANGPSKMGLGLVSMGVAMGVISVLF